jgi:leucyl aminopeptidase
MRVAFAEAVLPDSGTLVVLADEAGALGAIGRLADERTGGQLGRALAAREALKRGRGIELAAPAGTGLERILIIGAGKPDGLSAFEAESLGGTIAVRLGGLEAREAALAVDELPGCPLSPALLAARLAAGARLRAWRFTKYRTTPDDEDSRPPDALTVLASDLAAAEAAYAPLGAVVDGVEHARELVSEPGNVLYPETFAEACRGLAPLGLEVEVLDPAAIERLGMRTILAVGQGSARPPYVAVVQWRGGGADEAPLVLVGKGISFDTGGISIKPSGGMEEMKWDMAGAGAVFGAIKALALRKARANVVALLGFAENMPSGTAQRPGDVVTSLSGLTIEVVNTDAEGRLLLADLLWYAKDRFKPKAMIDLATLTGAVIVALGHENAGLFANDDELAARIADAGKAVGEGVWRLPVGEPYAKHIKSEIADIKNVGRNREAGSTAGAVFLQRFVGEVPWAHLDIAAMAWTKRDLALAGKGATGFGVRLLDRLIADHYES